MFAFSTGETDILCALFFYTMNSMLRSRVSFALSPIKGNKLTNPIVLSNKRAIFVIGRIVVTPPHRWILNF